MSHEIRTPMNGVLGMMEVLERSPLEAAQARNIAVMLASAAGAAAHLIDDVLDFRRSTPGEWMIEPSAVQHEQAARRHGGNAMLPQA